MATEFQASYKGIGEMLTAPYMVRAMLTRARAVKARCVDTAPVYRSGPHPGRYKRAFKVSAGVHFHKTARAYGRVDNDAPEAFFVEYGTRNNPAYHTMVAALDAVHGVQDAPRRNRAKVAQAAEAA